MTIRVTVEDLETGDKESREITDDVIVICEGNRYLSSAVSHANGTQIFTVKVDRS